MGGNGASRRQEKSCRVFLFSTYLDNAERRGRIVDVIDRLQIDGLRLTPIAMERFTASSQPAVAFCRDQSGSADLYLGILAWRHQRD